MKTWKLIIFITLLLTINGCSNIKENSPSITTSPKPTNIALPSVTPKPTSILTTVPSAPIPSSAPSISPVSESSSLTESMAATTDYKQTAQKILKDMSLEEKVGQMFLVRCDSATALNDIKKYHPGGFILFSENFTNQTKAGIRKTIKSYQSISDIPMLIGVDEEGGTVNRISKFKAFRSTPFKSPQELYRLGGFKLIQSDTVEKATLLKGLGINLNLAPVCDVSINPKDFIYQRSFGNNATKTSDYVKTVVIAMNSQKIGCTLKHFPGYGNNVDTHSGIAIDKRSKESFYNNDFLPFEAGIKAGAGSILVAHNIVNAFDNKNPASLSKVVHQILRQDLQYNGVIMTDDLSMQAITKYTNKENAAVLAVKAGNDLLIASDYKLQFPAVIAAVKNKSITLSRIDEPVLRILEWKLSLGIIKQ